MFDLVNIFFLIVGLILGIFIYYLIERIKEGRLRKNIAEILKNEITICGEDAKEDLERVQKIDSSEIPENVQKERIYLGAFVLSQSLYGTNVYESYMNKLYLFKGNTQKVIISFYNLIYKMKISIGSVIPLIEESKYPAQAVIDIYEIQYKIREKAIQTFSNCIKKLEIEKKNRLTSGIIKFWKRLTKKL